MQKMKKSFLNLFFFSFILFILFPFDLTSAISLGASTDGNYAEVKAGETAEFTILLWNSENSSFPVKFEAKQTQENIVVILKPKELILDPSRTELPGEKGKRYIQTRQGIMEMTPVKVSVKTSKPIDLGVYDVRVVAVAGTPGVSGVSTLIEKTFKFTLNVTKSPSLLETIGGKITKLPERITGRIVEQPLKVSVLVLLGIVCIFVVSWLIYKYV